MCQGFLEISVIEQFGERVGKSQFLGSFVDKGIFDAGNENAGKMRGYVEIFGGERFVFATRKMNQASEPVADYYWQVQNVLEAFCWSVSWIVRVEKRGLMKVFFSKRRVGRIVAEQLKYIVGELFLKFLLDAFARLNKKAIIVVDVIK